MKKEIKAWAIKVRGRSFYLSTTGVPFVYRTEKEAHEIADRISFFKDIKAEAVRVNVRVEEMA